jgi:hypothetical protein
LGAHDILCSHQHDYTRIPDRREERIIAANGMNTGLKAPVSRRKSWTSRPPPTEPKDTTMPDKTQPNDSNPPKIPWFLREKLITLAEAARLIPPLRKGKTGKATSVNPSTVFRWCTKGRRSRRNGKLVRLNMCLVGATNCTSIQALERFSRELNDEDDDLNKHDEDEDDGLAVGARPKPSPRSPGCQAKANVARPDQYQEAMQILAPRGYVD